MKIKKLLGELIRTIDFVSSPGYSHFHFQNDKRSKSVLGGLASFCIIAALFYIMIK